MIIDIINIILSLISLITIYFIYKDMGRIKHKLYNNTYVDLINVMNEELTLLPQNTKIEIAIRQYFFDKLEHVYRAYKSVKLNGVKQLAADGFDEVVLGSAETSLLKYSSGWPNNFFKEIDKINKDTFEQFIKSMTLLVMVSPAEDFESLLKAQVVDAFKNDVKHIFAHYQLTKTQITDEEYCKYYHFNESKRIVYKKHGDAAIQFENSITFSKLELKELLATGDDGIAKLFENLFLLDKDNKNFDSLIKLKSRYQRFLATVIDGTVGDNIERNNIHNALMIMINQL